MEVGKEVQGQAVDRPSHSNILRIALAQLP